MGEYAGSLRRALLLWKHTGVRAMTEPLADICCDLIPCELWGRPVTSVPCHPRNRRQRGWDPARELAQAVAPRIGSMYVDCFIRTSASRTQKSLDEQQRQANAAAMLRRSDRKPLPEAVLLLDDVRTTGATIRAASTLLYQSGCRKVHAFTLAQD